MDIKGAAMDGPRSDDITLYFDLADFATARTGCRSGWYGVKSTRLTVVQCLGAVYFLAIANWRPLPSTLDLFFFSMAHW